MATISCAWCGKYFEAPKESNRRFCSTACGHKGRSRKRGCKISAESYMDNYRRALESQKPIAMIAAEGRSRGLSYGKMQVINQQNRSKTR